MNEITPETLRELTPETLRELTPEVGNLTLWDARKLDGHLNDHADAWEAAIEENGAQRKRIEAREPQPMTDEEAHAYAWAIEQGYQSVAATHARTLARFIERVRLAALAQEKT